MTPAGASAQSTAPPLDLTRSVLGFGRHLLVQPTGDLRIVGASLPALPVSLQDETAPSEVTAESTLETRLRLTPSLSLEGSSWPLIRLWQLRADLELRVDTFDAEREGSTVLLHDPWEIDRQEEPQLRLSEAALIAGGSRMQLQLGLVRSGWGTGMLAGDGLDPPPGARRSPFGHRRFADRVVRALVAWTPLDPRREDGRDSGPPLTLALAADAVLDDDTASWKAGDRAGHVIGAASGGTRRYQGGVYAVHRFQDHAEGGHTEVTALDARVTLEPLRVLGATFFLEGEVALLRGSTTFSRSAIHEGPIDITQLGWVARTGLERHDLEAALEAGFASGDHNPMDAELRAFTFDRSYGVGLLLIPHLLRASTAAAAINVSDETYRAEPPRGYDRIATGGALRGAWYLHPRLAWHSGFGLSVMGGLLVAESTADYADPWQTGLSPGQAVGPTGEAGVRSFGSEVQLGVHYQLDANPLHVHARLEGALASPGEVFGEQDDLMGIWLRTGVAW